MSRVVVPAALVSLICLVWLQTVSAAVPPSAVHIAAKALAAAPQLPENFAADVATLIDKIDEIPLGCDAQRAASDAALIFLVNDLLTLANTSDVYHAVLLTAVRDALWAGESAGQ